ncbi:ribokinase [Polaromonas sp. OV174]|uniref:ribokinase n=1 Tax=Polaromonas sp. OV174 TaxID=1855300 RepID=UPI0008EAA1B4|nr:ribokinase [Polaromonas sp. OV174]SFB72849.1 ribokinase [Polaromonas sp. OV174]
MTLDDTAASGEHADVVCVASWNADLISRVARPIERGETLMASAFSISPGGKGSNAAVAAARQGARVALIARIGQDDFGRMGLKLWRDEGIATEQVEQVADEPSGVAQILVYDDGDNSIAVFPGAGAGLGAHHAEAARLLLSHCRVVMAPCEVPLAVTERAFAIAREAGAKTVLNPAPARPLPDALLALTDVLTPNESELLLLAGLDAGASTDAAAQVLIARGAAAVLVTLGGAGCRLYQAGQAPLSLPGRRMAVADTIGAGDTFTGALAAALARGEALPAAMELANAAAALSVTGHGAIGGMPSLAQVRALLAAPESE